MAPPSGRLPVGETITIDNHESTVLRKLLFTMDLEASRFSPTRSTRRNCIQQLTQPGSDFLLTMKANHRTLHHQISEQSLSLAPSLSQQHAIHAKSFAATDGSPLVHGKLALAPGDPTARHDWDRAEMVDLSRLLISLVLNSDASPGLLRVDLKRGDGIFVAMCSQPHPLVPVIIDKRKGLTL